MATWGEVYRALVAAPAGTTITVNKSEIGAPAGAVASIGLGGGEHYRYPPDPQCRGLHVRDEGRTYEAHLDQVHPDCGVVSHLREDAPIVFVASGALLGAALGGIVKGTGGAILGAALGMTASALFTR